MLPSICVTFVPNPVLLSIIGVILLVPTLTTAVSPSSPTVTTRKPKGELEMDYPTSGGGYGPSGNNGYPIVTSTLALIVPPQPQQGGIVPSSGNSWESAIYQTSGPGKAGVSGKPYQFINPNAYRSKGDDGINDTRGTVRYNFMPNGYLGRGIITHPADDSAPYVQANGEQKSVQK